MKNEAVNDKEHVSMLAKLQLEYPIEPSFLRR